MKPIESNRTQPSIRDYFLCSASKRKVAPQIESPESGLDPAENPRNPLPRSQESSGAITNVERTCNTKKEIDIGLTTEDLLALPNTPPASPEWQSSSISSSNCSAAPSPHNSQSHFASEMANVLAYVRGRPAPSDADHDLGDFEEWLKNDATEVSDDDEDHELSFEWPTDDRVALTKQNGSNNTRPTTSWAAKPFKRDAENRRIDALLNKGYTAGRNSWCNKKF